MTTAMTPSSLSARLESTFLMRACGYGEWRTLPTSIPETRRSSVYLPAPVVFSAASTIAVGLPMMEKSLLMYLQSLNIQSCHSEQSEESAFCGRRMITLQKPSLRALPQSPSESPRTSGCSRCSGKDCCLARHEHRLPMDLDFP